MLYILKLDLTKGNRIVPEATLLKMQNFLTIFGRAWHKPDMNHYSSQIQLTTRFILGAVNRSTLPTSM